MICAAVVRRKRASLLCFQWAWICVLQRMANSREQHGLQWHILDYSPHIHVMCVHCILLGFFTVP